MGKGKIKPEIIFNDERHEYTVDGRKTPSVTQILSAVGMYDFSGVNPQVLSLAAERGTVVHKIIELHEKGTLDDTSIDPELDGYFMAYIRCRKANGFDRLTEFEKVGYSEKYSYCGMLDAYGADARMIVDHKTTAKPSPVHGLQLSGYWMLLHPDYINDKPDELACAYYHCDGTYDYVKYDYQPLPWLSCLTVYNWKAKNGILK